MVFLAIVRQEGPGGVVHGILSKPNEEDRRKKVWNDGKETQTEIAAEKAGINDDWWFAKPWKWQIWPGNWL